MSGRGGGQPLGFRSHSVCGLERRDDCACGPVTVHERQEHELEEILKTVALPLVRSQPGIVSVVAGKPHADAPNVFCVTMV